MKTVKNDRGISLVIVLMIMVLLLSITGAGLIFSGTGLRTAGAFRAGTQAFYAAETGASVGINQISADPAAATVAFAGTIGNLAYRSGPRGATEPQPLQFKEVRTRAEFEVGSGTGTYSQQQGYDFYTYQINVTGTGPIGAAREVEILAEYGPVPK